MYFLGSGIESHTENALELVIQFSVISGKCLSITSFKDSVLVTHSKPSLVYVLELKFVVKKRSASSLLNIVVTTENHKIPGQINYILFAYYLVLKTYLEAMITKIKKAVSLIANPLIFFSAWRPTIKSSFSTSSSYTSLRASITSSSSVKSSHLLIGIISMFLLNSLYLATPLSLSL